jgi:hypothetical protein
MMKLYLGLTENSPPQRTRIFAEISGRVVDLNLAYAACLTARGDQAIAYELASWCFPEDLGEFLRRGEPALKALDEAADFARRLGAQDLRGPAGEKVAYNPTEIRILPPFQQPEKSFVIGFSDRARLEAMPRAEIPTGFYYYCVNKIMVLCMENSRRR